MGPEQRLSPGERANLVAYLDGELDEAETRAIATKLTQSPTARRELEALEKTWELLDFLPRPRPSAEFTARTLSLVEQQAHPDDRLLTVADRAARRALRVAVLALSALATIALAYAVTRWVWPDPTARLVRQLSLAENLDEYLDARSFAFLAALDDSPEFKDEVTLLSSDYGWGSPAENERQLRSLPRERRVALAGNLERFDRLDAVDRTAARDLDERLRQLDANDRTRYLSLLRRYHLWARNLPDRERQALKSAGDGDRIELVRRLRQEKGDRNETRIDNLRLQAVAPSPFSLFETATLIRIWLAIEPEQRARLEKMRPFDARLKRLRELGEEKGIFPGTGLFKAERAKIRKHLNYFPRLKKEIDALNGQDAPNAKQRSPMLDRFGEALYYLDNEPAPVDSRKLMQFAAAFPAWLSDQFDPLPPDAARRRLTILYRLIFPAGSEMEDAPREGKGQTPAPPAGSGMPARPAPSRAPTSAPGSSPAPF